MDELAVNHEVAKLKFDLALDEALREVNNVKEEMEKLLEALSELEKLF